MLTRRFFFSSSSLTQKHFASANFLTLSTGFRFNSSSAATTNTNNNKVKVTFIDGKKKLNKVCEGQLGQTLLNVGLANQMDIEAACDGTCACSTCHVYVDDEHFAKLPKATEDEEDMLDLALDRKHNSRLCCQVNLTKECDGMILTLPEEGNSQM
jgi:ferredoxin-2, mitochondrial